MKKILTGTVAVLAALTMFAGCTKKSQTNTSATTEDKTPVEKDVYTIGVIQLVEHPALNANYEGFVEGLKEAGFIDGKNIKIDYKNAQNDQSNCVTIADKFANDNVDLIFAIATPAAQAVANRTQTIPIVISSVTDPKSANLVNSNELPGVNVTGTSDLTPCEAQIDLLHRLYPQAKKVAMLFCSSEANSKFQVNLAKAACKKYGIKTIDATVSNTNEVQQVVQSLVDRVDAIYTPTDNMIASSMATVALVTTPNKIPVICGEDGMVQSGGLCTYGINYFELGKKTAAMAVEILKDKKNPAGMPIQYLDASGCEFTYNKDTAEQLGIEIPSDLLKE